MKNLWALRYVLGMLLVVGLTVYLFGWAVMRYPLYVGIGIAAIVALIVVNQPRVRRERARVDALVDAAFRDAYGPLSSPPSIVRSSSYGYPAFEIRFRSKAEMEAATAQSSVFKTAIDDIFRGYGPRSRPFSAEMAIFFTYDGHLDELRARYKNAEPREFCVAKPTHDSC